MKVNRVIQTYAVKITDEPFELSNGKILNQTARITFRDINKNIIEKKKYGVPELDDIYKKINHGQSLELSNCYIKNFSLDNYRNIYKLKTDSHVELNNFTAVDSIFEADRVVDFSYAAFIGNKIDFSNSHFGHGNLTFYQSICEDFNVDFSNTSYSEGNNSFQYTQFGKGNITFENASFLNGNLSFINTSFSDGNVNFKNINFGNGDVQFSYA